VDRLPEPATLALRALAGYPRSVPAFHQRGRPMARMDSYTIKTWQAEHISKGLYPGANYLSRLRNRMEKLFPPDDPLFLKVVAAQEAVRALSIEMHYQSCKTGVGRPNKAE